MNAEPSPVIPLGDNFAAELSDAELLLRYAAQSGIPIPPDVVEPILVARTALGAQVWSEAAIAAFLAATTRVAAMLKPVSVASLKTSPEIVARTVASYRRWGSALTGAVVVLSLVSFVNTGIADRITKDIDEDNALAAALRAEFGPSDMQYSPNENICVVTPGPIAAAAARPAINEFDTISQLQRFAAVLRDIDSRSVKLDMFVFKAEVRPDLTDPELQLDPQLADFHRAAFCKIGVYQKVRNFAQNILADDSVLFGAMSAYLLPVLYAVLGAFAFQIRLFTEQVRTRSFEQSRANAARIIAAVVAGSICSLFNGFNQGATLSPLAIAFLVGYGVEIFYAFLDKIVDAFASSAPRSAPSLAADRAAVPPPAGAGR